MEDRRTIKTRKALKSALTELISEKDINKITVTDLSKLANIGRGTFYLHYQNPYDLLENMENDIINDLGALLDKTFPNNTDANLSLYIEKAFEYLFENKEIIKILLDPNGSFLFLNKFRDFFLHKVLNEFIENLKTTGPESNSYYASFVIMGAIGVLQEWVINNMDLPPKKAAKIMETILLNPIQF